MRESSTTSDDASDAGAQQHRAAVPAKARRSSSDPSVRLGAAAATRDSPFSGDAPGFAAAAAAPHPGAPAFASQGGQGSQLATALSVIDEMQAKEGPPRGGWPRPQRQQRALTIGGAPRKASDVQVCTWESL